MDRCKQCGKLLLKPRKNGLCSKCVSDKDAIELCEGSYYLDRKGRFFVVESQRVALFAYGRHRPSTYSPVSLPAYEGKRKLEKQRAEMWEVVEENLGLAYKAARSFCVSPGTDIEELVSDHGLMALGRAAVTFNPVRGVQFSTYATAALVRAYTKAIRSRLVLDRNLSSRVEADSTEIDLIDEESERDSTDILELQLLRSSIEKLSNADRWLYDQYFVRGRTHRDIGVELGLIPGSCRARVIALQEKIRRGMFNA